MSADATPVRLKKEVTLPQLFALAFGSIIGVGWITVLGFWLSAAGPGGAVLAFAAAGVVILLIGLCYAEMATAIPVAGGEVAYAYQVFGLRASFVVGWLLVLGYAGVVVFEVISVGWVLEALAPALRGPVLYSVAGSDVSLGGLVGGLAGMAAIAWFNIRGAKTAARFQELLIAGLFVMTLIFVGFAFARGDGANLQPLFAVDASGLVLPGILAVFVTAPFWFSGFDVIPQAMGERSGTASLKLVPWVLALSIGAACLFYIAIIMAASMSLERAALLSAELPTADALAAAVGSDAGGKIVLTAGLLGLISSWNAFTYGASRVVFALGRAGIIFRPFGTVHATHKTPAKAILFVSALGFAGAFFGKAALMPVVESGALAFACVFLAVCFCAIRFRNHPTGVPASFRTPGGAGVRYLAALLALFIVLYAFYSPYQKTESVPVEWIIFAGWLVFGLVLYVAGAAARNALSPEARRRLLYTDIEDPQR